MLPIICFQTQLGLCPLPWNVRHACTMTLTLHLIMSLHVHQRGPIKPVHCACKYDICSVIYVPNSKAWTQLSSPTRYVKNSLTCYTLPDMGYMATLWRTKRYVLKQPPNPALAVSSHIFISNRVAKIW